MEIDDFINSGFTKHSAGFESNWAECLLQKRILDDSGNTKYFINVYPSTVSGQLTFTARARFYRNADSFQVDLLPEYHHTPEYIQQTMEAFWKDNNMGIDPHN
mgnify:CR=1 FL=1